MSASILHRVYTDLLDGRPLPDRWNEGIMVFLGQKVSEVAGGAMADGESVTRPLTLSNTSSKLVAKLQDVGLADAAALTVADFQFGFLRGRLSSDAVFKAESEALDHAIVVDTAPAIWLLDQRNAFPRLLHAFVRWVLVQSGFPAFFRRALVANYRKVEVTIRLGGHTHGTIRIDRGIKQGCPMSGTLWATAFDPVIRFLQAAAASVPASLTVYADDVAIAAAQVVEAGRRAFRSFDIVAPAIGMELNAAETVAVVCYPHDPAGLSALLSAVDLRAVSVLLRSSALHLGVPVGPAGRMEGGHPGHCLEEPPGRGRRAVAARSTGHAYRTYVAPVPAYPGGSSGLRIRSRAPRREGVVGDGGGAVHARHSSESDGWPPLRWNSCPGPLSRPCVDSGQGSRCALLARPLAICRSRRGGPCVGRRAHGPTSGVLARGVSDCFDLAGAAPRV